VFFLYYIFIYIAEAYNKLFVFNKRKCNRGYIREDNCRKSKFNNMFKGY
jgi:hypothetical protein